MWVKWLNGEAVHMQGGSERRDQLLMELSSKLTVFHPSSRQRLAGCSMYTTVGVLPVFVDSFDCDPWKEPEC